MVGKDTSFNADILAQLSAATGGPTGEEMEDLPVDYPFVEDEELNLY